MNQQNGTGSPQLIKRKFFVKVPLTATPLIPDRGIESARVAVQPGELFEEIFVVDENDRVQHLQLLSLDHEDVCLEASINDLQEIGSYAAELLLPVHRERRPELWKKRHLQDFISIEVDSPVTVWSRDAMAYPGIVRYVGGVPSLGPGIWFGVVLPHHLNQGTSDGSVQGKRYFSCPQRSALFVTAAQLYPREPEKESSKSEVGESAYFPMAGKVSPTGPAHAKGIGGAVAHLASSVVNMAHGIFHGAKTESTHVRHDAYRSMGTNEARVVSAGSHLRSSRMENATRADAARAVAMDEARTLPVRLGDRVNTISDAGAEPATVRWIGRLGEENDLIAGVEYEQPIGSGTGVHGGDQLFVAKPNYAAFVPLSFLIKSEDLANGSDGPPKSNGPVPIQPQSKMSYAGAVKASSDPPRTSAGVVKRPDKQLYQARPRLGAQFPAADDSRPAAILPVKSAPETRQNASSQARSAETSLKPAQFGKPSSLLPIHAEPQQLKTKTERNSTSTATLNSGNASWNQSLVEKNRGLSVVDSRGASNRDEKEQKQTPSATPEIHYFQQNQISQYSNHVTSVSTQRAGLVSERAPFKDDFVRKGVHVELFDRSSSSHQLRPWETSYQSSYGSQTHSNHSSTVPKSISPSPSAGSTHRTEYPFGEIPSPSPSLVFRGLEQQQRDVAEKPERPVVTEYPGRNAQPCTRKSLPAAMFSPMSTSLKPIPPPASTSPTGLPRQGRGRSPVRLRTVDGGLFGKKRGIQGHKNSCYLDATLFSMFAFSNALDEILHRPRLKGDINGYEEVQHVLREFVVKPLRNTMYVDCEDVMRLRELMDDFGDVTGLTDEERDPEEFLTSLLQQVLKVQPLLKLTTGDCNWYTLFVQKNQMNLIPTLQTLFDESLVESDVRLKEAPRCLLLQTPRSGAAFKMYRYILPSSTLDITDAISGYPRTCCLCGDVAEIECRDCFKWMTMEEESVSNLSTMAFCTKCSVQRHKIKNLAKHNPQALRITMSPLAEGRVVMELFAVLCIKTSHYVTFAKDGSGLWCFVDSMADREGEGDIGFNIPEVRPCPEINEYLEPGKGHELLMKNLEENKLLPEPINRFFEDCYFCMYQPINSGAVIGGDAQMINAPSLV